MNSDDFLRQNIQKQPVPSEPLLNKDAANISNSFIPPGQTQSPINREVNHAQEAASWDSESEKEVKKTTTYTAPKAFEPAKAIQEKPKTMGSDSSPSPEATKSNNPLRNYFRSPGIFIKLPSLGNYHPKPIDATIDGTIPIYQMSASEELLARSPDAILSGFAVENIVKSCAPSIKSEVRDIPASDVDAILLAVQAITYGDAMEMAIECTECNHKNEVEISRQRAIESMTHMKSEVLCELGDGLIASIKPYSYASIVALSLATFEEHRRLQLVEEDKEIVQEEKMNIMNASMMRLTKLALSINADSIIYIRTPDTIVTDNGFIKEFVINAERRLTTILEKAIGELNSIGVNRKVAIECEKCGHINNTEFTADLLVPFSNAS